PSEQWCTSLRTPTRGWSRVRPASGWRPTGRGPASPRWRWGGGPRSCGGRARAPPAPPALALVGVAGIWWLVRRRPSAPVHVVDGVAPVAAVSALLVGATVLSPQYVSWLLPFAAIAAAGGDRLIGWMTALVAGLSTLDLNLVKEVNSGLPL